MKYLTLMVTLWFTAALSAAPSYTPKQEREVAFCSGLLNGYNSENSTNMMTYLIEIAKPTDRYHFMLVREYDRGIGYVEGWHEACLRQQSCNEASLSYAAISTWKHFKCSNYGLDTLFNTPTTPEKVIGKANTEEVNGSAKIGSNPDDEPCTCVFNKNRMWNPDKIVWNNEEWVCTNYTTDGLCSEVSKVEGAPK